MSEIVRHQPQMLAIPDQMRYAEVVTTGDMIPAAYKNKPANALIAIGLGQAMGLSPAESLYRIDVIQGKPTASAELIASNVRKAGHKLRVEVDEAATSVRATIFRADDPDYPHSVVRDMAWAKKMGLQSKDNYLKQPLTMLQWRAISAVARLACSEALYGVAYTPDELGDLGERNATPAPASVADRLKAAKAEPQQVESEAVTDWRLLAGTAEGDKDTLRAIWIDAKEAGADDETLSYIINSVKEPTT